jgi:CRP-like cAMP-binding protein
MYLTLATSHGDDTVIDPTDHRHPRDTHPGHRPSHRLTAGHTLFFEGDEAEHLYEVQSGMLRLARVLENGRRQIVAFGLPGDVVGFPDDGLHHTDCDAICDSVVVAHRVSALETPAGDPALHRRLTRAALHEICALQDHFMMLSSKSAAEKIASFLLTLAERTGTPCGRSCTLVNLPMRRVDIAEFLGLTTETVCRTITQFRKARLILLEDAQTVIIPDLAAMRARAEPE